VVSSAFKSRPISRRVSAATLRKRATLEHLVETLRERGEPCDDLTLAKILARSVTAIRRIRGTQP
jgi:hypothetical protein